MRNHLITYLEGNTTRLGLFPEYTDGTKNGTLEVLSGSPLDWEDGGEELVEEDKEDEEEAVYEAFMKAGQIEEQDLGMREFEG